MQYHTEISGIVDMKTGIDLLSIEKEINEQGAATENISKSFVNTAIF